MGHFQKLDINTLGRPHHILIKIFEQHRELFYHLIFWMSLFFLFIAIDNTGRGMLFVCFMEGINVIFYAFLVYFNVLYLIPNYLTTKKFSLYAALLILVVLVFTPFKVIIFYLLTEAYPEIQGQIVNERNWYFLSSFVITGSSTIIKIVSDWATHQRDRKELVTQNMQSELQFLKSQINPHFLFNTLNSLYALTLKKSDKAPEIVIKLAEMMRYMLYECNEKQVTLKKEVNYIKNYLDLERLRHGDHVLIKFDIHGEVENQMIAPLLFIPFLENSFKHGLNKQIDQSYVSIHLAIKRDNVEMWIENSKPATLPLQRHKKSGGIGLVNVKRRLNILYPNKHDLNITEKPDSYRVDLNIILT